jgi:O-antigen ligase
MTEINPKILTIPKLFIVLGFFLLPLTFLRIFLNLSVSDILFATGLICTMLTLIPFRIYSIEKFLRGNIFFIPMLILSAGFFLSLPNSERPLENFTAYIQIFFIFCIVYPLLRLIVVEDEFVRKALKYFVFSTGVVSVALMIFTIYGFDLSYGLFLLQEGWRGRFSYGGHEPNIPARIVLQMAPLCAVFFLRTKSISLKLINILLIFVSGFVVISTASRSSFLALILGTILFPIFLKHTNPKLSITKMVAWISCIAIIGIITIGYFTEESFFSAALKRYETILSTRTSASSLTRINLVDQSIDQITGNPIIGVGLDNFELYTREGINVHNPILSIWAESGILGMIGFSLIYFIFVLYCIKSWQRRFFGNYLMMGMTIMVILMIVGDMFMANSYKRVLWIPALLFLTYYEVLSARDEK